MERNNYYNSNRILSKEEPFNFIIGGRGIGKSYEYKRLCIANYLKKGEQFVYIRRYQSDLDTVLPTLFEDTKQAFPTHTLEIVGNDIFVDGKQAGWAIAVSSFTKHKSTVFDLVTTLLFDEFIPEDGKYIGGRQRPNMEVELCLNFYQSVARGYKKPIREEVRFIFIANAVTINNPYFRYFNITPMLEGGAKFARRDGLCVEIVKSSNVLKKIAESKFGKLIEGTRYGDYAVGNEFYQDSNEFVQEQPKGRGLYVFNVRYNGKTYGFIRYQEEDIYYITENINPEIRPLFALTREDHSINNIMFDVFDKHRKVLKRLFQLGSVRFQNQACKLMFLAIIE